MTIKDSKFVRLLRLNILDTSYVYDFKQIQSRQSVYIKAYIIFATQLQAVIGKKKQQHIIRKTVRRIKADIQYIIFSALFDFNSHLEGIFMFIQM